MFASFSRELNSGPVCRSLQSVRTIEGNFISENPSRRLSFDLIKSFPAFSWFSYGTHLTRPREQIQNTLKYPLNLHPIDLLAITGREGTIRNFQVNWLSDKHSKKLPGRNMIFKSWRSTNRRGINGAKRSGANDTEGNRRERKGKRETLESDDKSDSNFASRYLASFVHVRRDADASPSENKRPRFLSRRTESTTQQNVTSFTKLPRVPRMKEAKWYLFWCARWPRDTVL